MAGGKLQDALRSLKDGVSADGHARRALTHAEGAVDADLQIRALSLLAMIAGDAGDLSAARGWLERALPVSIQARNPVARPNLLDSLARNANARGDPETAVRYQTEAIEIADRLQNATIAISTRGSRATAFLALGRYDDALADAEDAYDLARKNPRPMLRAVAAFSLAQAHAHIWSLDRAAAAWTEAIAAYGEAHIDIGVALATKQRMETWFAMGDYDRAADDGRTALKLFERTGSAGTDAELLSRLALVETKRGQPDSAARYAASAATALAGVPPARRVFAMNDLGLLALENGQAAEAEERFRQALDVAEAIGNPEYAWRAHMGLGRAALALGRVDAAEEELRTAVAAVERLRRTLPEAGLRAGFMTDRVAPHEALVEVLQARSSKDAASAERSLEIAERARSRGLADLLAEARAGLTDSRLAPIRERERAFARRFSDVQKRAIDARDPGTRRAALDELDRIERDYETLAVRIRRENPGYAALVYPRPLTARDIAAVLSPDEAMVEFLITKKKGFAWVVRGSTVRSYEVPGSDLLDPQVRLMRALLNAHDQPAIERIGSHFYDRLLAPARGELAGAHRVIVVADGPLRGLPFAALRHDGRWLIEDTVIAMAPSATVLSYLRQTPRERATQPLLAFAVTRPLSGAARALDSDRGAGPPGPLVGAEREAMRAARLLDAPRGALLVGAAASEAALTSGQPDRYRILHFAAHTIIDEVVPRRSAIVLEKDAAEDGLMQVNEIANLSLNADLVVLAGCRTQMGREVRGEGLLSLSRAFIHAGARAVAATLWPVDDRATAALMGWFYGALAEGVSGDEALRAAQLQALGSGGSMVSAANWSGFVITGDARVPIVDHVRPNTSPRNAAWALVASTAALAVLPVSWRIRRRSAHLEAGRR